MKRVFEHITVPASELTILSTTEKRGEIPVCEFHTTTKNFNRMKNQIKLVCIICSFALFSSCELMPLQKDYKYQASVIDPHVNMTAWEYLHTRPELFSIMIEALEYTGLKSYYEQADSAFTFLALTDIAMESYLRNTPPRSNDIKLIDQNTVSDMIKYHIIQGRYSSYYKEIPVEPMFVPTLLKGEAGLMTLVVRKSPWPGLVGQVAVNDAQSNASSPYRTARTCNIITNNGVIHVFDNYCFYKK